MFGCVRADGGRIRVPFVELCHQSSADGQAEQKQGMHSEAARFLDEEGRAGGLRSSLGDQVEDALINEKDVNVGEWQGL